MSSVTLGMTTKGINSTSRQISGGVTVDAKLKDPVCGLHSPVFKVKGLSKTYNNYNFCIWRGRYYWVDEILFLTNDIQEVHCHLDALATFKGAIDDTYAYVQYGDAANWNKFIDDIRISPELEEPAWCDTQMFKIVDMFDETGVIVMRYMDCGQGGGVKTISMTPSAFFGMLDDLYALINSSTVSECFGYIGGCGSWRDNILSCVWVPFKLQTTGYSQIRLGGVTCNVNCYYIQNAISVYAYDKSIDIDWSVFNDWPFAKTSRWTSCQFITPFGYADIPIDLLRNQSKIYYRMAVDYTAGDISIKISERTNGDGYCYASFGGNVAIDMMGTLGTGHGWREGFASSLKAGAEFSTALLSSVLGGAGAVQMADNNVVKAMSTGLKTGDWDSLGNAYDKLTATRNQALTSGINSIAQSLPTGVGHSNASGSIGGGAARLWLTSPIGNCLFIMKSFRPLLKNSYDDFCDMYGYPVNYYLQLSSVTGFCKCSGAFVRDIPGATPADISTINSFLNSGIVLED